MVMLQAGANDDQSRGIKPLGINLVARESGEKLSPIYSISFYSFCIQDRVKMKEILLHQTKCEAKYLAKHVVFACFVGAKPFELIMVD